MSRAAWYRKGKPQPPETTVCAELNGSDTGPNVELETSPNATQIVSLSQYTPVSPITRCTSVTREVRVATNKNKWDLDGKPNGIANALERLKASRKERGGMH